LAKSVSELKSSGTFTGEDGEVFPLSVNGKICLLVAVKKKSSLTDLRISVKHAIASPYLKKAKSIEILPHEKNDSVVAAIVEGIILGNYSWKKYCSSKDKKEQKKTFTVVGKKTAFCKDIETIALGVNFARDLVNDNADVVDAIFMEKAVRALIKGKANISAEILGQKELKSKGLNLHLAVNQGSAKQPRLIIIKYKGAAKNAPYTAIIGKGLTFDSGGLNIKPSGYMETMRMDMGGSAAVAGTLKNILALKPKKNIIFVCAMAENAVGSRSYKPGDVIKGYGGKTVEVMNTDAEGRLVLADAISYIVKNYKPGKIIDIATLTGACFVALGYDYTGLVSTDDTMAKELLKSAEKTDDRAWRLPIYTEIEKAMKSKIADLRNTSTIKGAGTITAAEFLRQFTEDTKWAHLDIAGTAFVDGAERMYFNHGATGSGVRLLTDYLLKN